PDTTLSIGVLGGMGAQDGTVDAELYPAGIEFRRNDAGHVSADVVAPIGVPDVGRGGGEPGLKGQRLPHGNGVAGKADLVAMVAEASPAMEEQRTFAFALLITEVHVIQPPCRIHAGGLRVGFLLPV